MSEHDSYTRAVVEHNMKKITIILTLLLPFFIYSQDENLVPFNCQEKWGYCDKEGNEVIKPKYDDAKFFVDGIAVVKLENKYGMVDINGIQILPCKYDEIKNYDLKNDLILARLNKNWIQFNSNSKRVNKNSFYGSTIYDCVQLNVTSGLAELYIHKYNDKYGFVSYRCQDTQNDSSKIYGEPVFDNYQEIGLLYVALKKNNIWKIYNYSGKQANSNEYTWIDPLAIDRRQSLFYRVKRNDKYGLINSVGDELIEPKYDKMDVVNEIYEYSENWLRKKELFLKIENGNKSFYINSQGIEYVCTN